MIRLSFLPELSSESNSGTSQLNSWRLSEFEDEKEGLAIQEKQSDESSHPTKKVKATRKTH